MIILIFICKFKTDECFLFMKRFQVTSWRLGVGVYSLQEVKHIMIMIIAIINFLFSYVIFDQQLKIAFIKSSGPLKKSIPATLKIKKVFFNHPVPAESQPPTRTLCRWESDNLLVQGLNIA